jgi:hypothetical protein
MYQYKILLLLVTSVFFWGLHLAIDTDEVSNKLRDTVDNLSWVLQRRHDRILCRSIGLHCHSPALLTLISPGAVVLHVDPHESCHQDTARKADRTTRVRRI